MRHMPANTYRRLIRELGWNEATAAKNLGIGARHARKLAAGHVKVTRTLELLLAATFELRELRGDANSLAGVDEAIGGRIMRLVEVLRETNPPPVLPPEPPPPVPPAPEPPPPVFWAPSQRLPQRPR
jgi:hypothetical protein